MLLKTISASIFTLLILCTSVLAQELADTFFITEDLPPFSYSLNGENKGLSVDILKAALRAAEIDPESVKIHIYSWPRGMKTTLNRPNTCLFATVRKAERENLFKWAGPIADVDFALVSLKNDLTINDLSEINNYTVGALKTGISHLILKEKFHQGTRVELSTTILSMLKKLQRERVDFILESEHTLHHVMMQNGFDWKNYKIHYVFNFGQTYFAFNKNTADHIVQKLQDGIDKIRKSGELSRIQNNYLPETRPASTPMGPIN
ncbi:ABC transporter substrate-binding protein [Desulfovibrio sp. JC010]|uniref:substrate-binding periplasmic protein n=1 Tax=Desulfovibrio sp. JC010 TaxID=2593641 RepID=UPI0013D43269|nr:transporter substrate-binding domain-containing protein [Desulfovibrio sp. JC010]NDV26855.1 transporter substrate-binding domain-containing protein [Desulfovibrio sp. JC010]